MYTIEMGMREYGENVSEVKGILIESFRMIHFDNIRGKKRENE